MIHWIHVALLAASVGCLSTLLLVFMWRLCHHHHKKDHMSLVVEEEHAINNNHQSNKKKKSNFYVLRAENRRPFFNWDDHPYLAADAVENGWSRFAFMGHKNCCHMPSSSKKTSTLLGACAGFGVDHDGREEIEPEISWEVFQGSNESMQKIRLNPNNNNSSVNSVVSVIRTSLPLPGPSLGNNNAFPQEAYFEIIILCDDHNFVGKRGEGEKTKLLIQGGSTGNLDNVEEMKLKNEEGEKSDSVNLMFSLGLTAGGDVPLRVPGSYPGSIGFNSNGSVFLDGMKLVFESKEAEWIGTAKVIGCGFDPKQKKVFFTVDSELVHVIHCKSEEYGTPLCPTLAANMDIIVLVNFGQSAFKYSPANAHRTPNPCFFAPILNSHAAAGALGYYDSKELFSMERIDSQWHNRSTTKGNNHNNGSTNLAFDFDEESEADLYEIVLDGSGKSPEISRI